MEAFLFIGGTWLIAGFLTFILFPIVVKMGKATPFPFFRALFSGYLGILCFLTILIFVGKETGPDEDLFLNKK